MRYFGARTRLGLQRHKGEEVGIVIVIVGGNSGLEVPLGLEQILRFLNDPLHRRLAEFFSKRNTDVARKRSFEQTFRLQTESREEIVRTDDECKVDTAVCGWLRISLYGTVSTGIVKRFDRSANVFHGEGIPDVNGNDLEVVLRLR